MLKNELTQSELKKRMNFSQMLDRQSKQIQGNSHIQGLLGGQKKESNPDISDHNIILADLDRHFKLNTDRHLNTLDSINEIKELLNNKKIMELNFNHPRHYKKLLYTVLIMCLGTIIWTVNYTPIKVVTKEKIIEKTIEKVSYPYFAQKYINLRSAPSTQATKKLVISPNTVLKILEKNGDWRKIEFRDYINHKTIQGWIYGENIQKI